MSKLFIIGNGFDRAHGMATSYEDFHNFLRDKYNLTDEDVWFSIKINKVLIDLDIDVKDMSLLGADSDGSIMRFKVAKHKNTDEDNYIIDDTIIPFQIAYAVSIHKAQGLEFESVKILISQEVDEQITHNVFYTAVTRARKYLKIYWTPETQEKVLNCFKKSNIKKQIDIYKAHCKYLDKSCNRKK